MDKNFIIKMKEKYHEYKNSAEQTDLKRRLVENERWFRRKQTELLPKFNSGDNQRIPTVRGGYLFNAILTKHADAMDNYLDVTVLPREKNDVKLAQTLTGVVSYVLERNDFESVYSDNWFSKLKTSCAYAVTWDDEANDGEGEVKISKAELINLFWQPNVTDIQQSEFVFYHSYIPKKVFVDTYGLNKLVGAEYITHIDTYDSLKFDLKNEFVLIIDAYYKVKKKNKTYLHFARFSGTSLLFASEDEKDENGIPLYPTGYYDDGNYPFVFDVLFPAEQSIAGFGIVDAVKDVQAYSDSLDTMLQINNQIVGKPRYLVSNDLGISNQDLVDLNKDIIKFNGSISPEKFMKLPIDALPQQIEDSIVRKADELKEIIGNREFQQGGTQKGVVSGTAISILQASGDKLSRDMLKTTYRNCSKIILLVIERIRQFYDNERTIRIIGDDGNDEFIKFSNSEMTGFGAPLHSASSTGDLGIDVSAPFGVEPEIFGNGSRIPMFDVKLSIQKSNPYSRELNNQTVLELAKLGLLDPTNLEINLPVLNALQFDGKEAIIKDLREVSDKLKSESQPPSPDVSGDVIGNVSEGSNMVFPSFSGTQSSGAVPYDANFTVDEAIPDEGMVDITDLIKNRSDNGGQY